MYDQISIANDDISPDPIGSLSAHDCKYYSVHDFMNRIGPDSYPVYNCYAVLALNCRGLMAHWDDFKHLIAETTNDKFQFDIIGLSEIFQIHTNINLPGYHNFIFKSRPDDTDTRGGIGFFIKQSYTFKIRNDLSIFIPNVIETLFIEITNIHKKACIFGIIYRPNSPPKASIDTFTDNLFDIIDQVNITKQQLTLMGDFNIDLLQYTNHSKTSNFIDNIISSGMMPHITKPTRITDHSATLIDHIYTNNIQVNNRITSGIITTDISDHFATFSITQLQDKIKPQITFKTTRDLSEANLSKFKTELNQTDFSTIYQTTCPTVAYTNFINIYSEAFEKTCPLRTKIINEKKINHEPWLTKGILKSSRTKNKLYKAKLKKPTDEKITKYKTYCNLYNKITRKAKNNYYVESLNMYKHDIKQTWKILKQAMNNQTSKTDLGDSFLINDKLDADPNHIANGFNSFFTHIASKLNQNIEINNVDPLENLSNQPVHSFFISPTTPDDILTIANHMKPKLSYGPDNISTQLMQKTIDETKDILSHIFNLSFTNGIVPTQLKHSRIIPIYKKGNNTLFSNYRPISLLPAFSKLLEKIIYKQLHKYLQDQNILNEHQYGFRPINTPQLTRSYNS